MKSHLHRAILAALLLAGCTQGGGPPSGEGRKKDKSLAFPVEVRPVASEAVEYLVTAPGQVEAFEIVAVTARVSGVAESVSFAVGDAVDPGQVLLRIEPERFRLALAQAQASLARAEALQAEATAALARREAAEKASPGVLPAEDLDSARTRVRAATADLALSRAAAATAELNLRDAEVRPPLAGVVQSREVSTGRYVQPGIVIATMVRRDPLQIRFRVPEIEAVSLQVGMPLRFRVGSQDAPLNGTIQAIAETADANSRLVEVLGRTTDPAAAKVRPGSFAQIEVPLARQSRPVIPSQAIRASERGFLAYIVLRRDDRLVAGERCLTLGLRTTDGRVEVRSGLEVGELLVISGQAALKEGTPVELRRADGKPAEPKATPMLSPATAASTVGKGRRP